MPNVWIVTNAQLLAWVQNPVPLSQLDSFEPLKCPVPNVPNNKQICNGITQNELGLLQNCPFIDFPSYVAFANGTKSSSADLSIQQDHVLWFEVL